MKYIIFCGSMLLVSACSQKVEHSVYVLTKEDSVKLDLTSYPQIRQEVTEYMHATAPDKQVSGEMFAGCGDDLVAVGPEGRRSISGVTWKKNFQKEAVTFKKVIVVPGTEIVRLYNEGQTAVRSVLLNVTLETPMGEINNDIMRTEIFIKKGDQWCMVAGQGTEPFASHALKLMATYGYPLIGFILGLLTMWFVRKVTAKKTSLSQLRTG